MLGSVYKQQFESQGDYNVSREDKGNIIPSFIVGKLKYKEMKWHAIAHAQVSVRARNRSHFSPESRSSPFCSVFQLKILLSASFSNTLVTKAFLSTILSTFKSLSKHSTVISRKHHFLTMTRQTVSLLNEDSFALLLSLPLLCIPFVSDC